MAENVQVSCIRKREHENPHERIQGLGGMHNGQRWYQLENDIIAELEKPPATRRWDYYTSVVTESPRGLLSLSVRDGNTSKRRQTRRPRRSPASRRLSVRFRLGRLKSLRFWRPSERLRAGQKAMLGLSLPVEMM